MPINIYRYQKLPVKNKRRLFQRSSANYEKVKQEIFPLIQQIREQSDKPILTKYKKRLIPIKKLQVSKKEFKQAYQEIDSSFLEAFKLARSNLEKVCKAQKKSLADNALVNENGIKVWREWRAISSVGIYAPGGRANYPSSLLMCSVPAIIAGCEKIIACAPPNELGELPAELLVTAKELGIGKVFKVGGPQAIAAMAYGTKSIPKVLKIVGPGNQYVTAAKLAVYPQTAIDLPAGPSENLIIVDQTANPAFAAADLITDTEHDPDSTAILLTDSKKIARAVKQEITRLLKQLSTKKTIEDSLQKYGGIILVDSMQQAIDISNEYAPEHMQIMTKNPGKLAKKVLNAGSVFIGSWSAKAGGDYTVGANHVLPTGQAAKAFGGLSVDSFGKWVEFQQVSKRGFLKMSQAIETYAQVENLPAHKLSSSIRNNYENQ
ncbi:MAG: histidinol dehydrogenase [Patescibacteria group bacterium]